MTDQEQYDAQQEYDMYQTIMLADEISKEDDLFCIKYDPESKDNWFYNGYSESYAYSSRSETYLNMEIQSSNQAEHDEYQLQIEIG